MIEQQEIILKFINSLREVRIFHGNEREKGKTNGKTEFWGFWIVQ